MVFVGVLRRRDCQRKPRLWRDNDGVPSCELWRGERARARPDVGKMNWCCRCKLGDDGRMSAAHELSHQIGALRRQGRGNGPRGTIAPPQQGQISSESPVSLR
jgi:hypothetical protein